MKTRRWLAAAVAAIGVAALVVAGRQFFSARAAQRELEAARRAQVEWPARLAELEKKARAAERHAGEAERDTAELLKAVDSVRAPRVADVAAKPPPERTRGTIEPPGPPIPEEEKQRLAQERAYQQELAKRRAAEAKARAIVDLTLREKTPEDRFALLLNAAKTHADQAEFQAALRRLNEALDARPADLPLPAEVRELQQKLAAQSTPVDMALLSDGVTFVSIAGHRPPARFVSQTVKLLPGNYEVVGRRPGFREVRTLIVVRSDVPAPVATVACTVPGGP